MLELSDAVVELSSIVSFSHVCFNDGVVLDLVVVTLKLFLDEAGFRLNNLDAIKSNVLVGVLVLVVLAGIFDSGFICE
jgi:hypothetical protein